MIKRILVSIDGTPFTKIAIQRAVELAPAHSAQYCPDHGFVTPTRLISGRADRKLLPMTAEPGTDMIVMGNSIHRVRMRKVPGDTVPNTLTRADRPLFLSQ